MAIRKHPTKRRDWWQIVVSQGRNKKQRVYTFQGAEAEARAFEAEIRGVPLERKDVKIVDMVGRFFDWYAIHRADKTNEECKRAFRRLLPHLGDRYLTLLHRNDYERYVTARLASGVSKRTVNIELTYFRAFLRWARETGHQPGEDPTLFSKKQTQPKHRSAPLTVSEIRALLDQLEGDKKTIVMLYALCGLRRDEALKLTRRQVDMGNNTLTITGKGNKTRIMPIVSAELAESLKTACKDKHPADYLFICARTKKPYNNIKKSIIAAAERAGIEKQVWNHLLRHSFGTAAVAAGLNLRSIQAMLGHSDIRTTEIYTHMAADLLHAEALKLTAWHQVSDTSETDKPKKKS